MFLKLNLQCIIDSLFNTKCITNLKKKKLLYMLYELAWSCDYDPVRVKLESRTFQESMYQPRSQ